MRNNRMIPYILIVSGSLLILSGIGILVKQKANKASIVQVPVQHLDSILPPATTSDNQPIVNNYEKGYDFEKWVVEHTNKEFWKIKEWQGDKYHNGQYPSSNRNPDLLFTVQTGGAYELVALECKWRKDYSNNGIKWASEEQIDIYNRFGQERGAKVFVVIGVGGTPSLPENVFIVPLSALRFPYASRDYLVKYQTNNMSGKFNYDFQSAGVVLKLK